MLPYGYTGNRRGKPWLFPFKRRELRLENVRLFKNNCCRLMCCGQVENYSHFSRELPHRQASNVSKQLFVVIISQQRSIAATTILNLRTHHEKNHRCRRNPGPDVGTSAGTNHHWCYYRLDQHRLRCWRDQHRWYRWYRWRYRHRRRSRWLGRFPGWRWRCWPVDRCYRRRRRCCRSRRRCRFGQRLDHQPRDHHPPLIGAWAPRAPGCKEIGCSRAADFFYSNTSTSPNSFPSTSLGASRGAPSSGHSIARLGSFHNSVRSCSGYQKSVIL
ncbi:hypothetical protein SRABI118_00511 [Massilia sp. Bi118]|nr:hypothetical protein SRABI118_00511 [Massilia sp. Bi118]